MTPRRSGISRVRRELYGDWGWALGGEAVPPAGRVTALAIRLACVLLLLLLATITFSDVEAPFQDAGSWRDYVI